MKIKFPLTSGCGLVAQALLVLITSISASAQNFVRNPDFEEPLGPTNWTIVYVAPSGPADFLVAGRTTSAHKDLVAGIWDGEPNFTGSNYWSRLGGHFAPNHVGLMHAYFRQVVTGLTAFASYSCSAWMVQFTRNDNYLIRAQVYMEVLGGATGTISVKTPYVFDNANNNPGGWKRYVVTNTASSSGQIEIRLHYDKIQTISYANNPWEYRNLNAYYDHVSVRPAGQEEYTPPYNIDSFTLANQTATLGWGTLPNHIYGIQATSDLLSGTNWNWTKLFLVATGANMTADLTVTTNVTGRYFRINRVWPYP